MKRSEFLNKTRDELEQTLKMLRKTWPQSENEDFELCVKFIGSLLLDEGMLKSQTDTPQKRRQMYRLIETVKAVVESYNNAQFNFSEENWNKLLNTANEKSILRSKKLESNFEDDTEDETTATKFDLTLECLGIDKNKLTDRQYGDLKKLFEENEQLFEEDLQPDVRDEILNIIDSIINDDENEQE